MESEVLLQELPDRFEGYLVAVDKSVNTPPACTHDLFLLGRHVIIARAGHADCSLGAPRGRCETSLQRGSEMLRHSEVVWLSSIRLHRSGCCWLHRWGNSVIVLTGKGKAPRRALSSLGEVWVLGVGEHYAKMVAILLHQVGATHDTHHELVRHLTGELSNGIEAGTVGWDNHLGLHAILLEGVNGALDVIVVGGREVQSAEDSPHLIHAADLSSVPDGVHDAGVSAPGDDDQSLVCDVDHDGLVILQVVAKELIALTIVA